jgi:hypothetical protein
MEIIMITEERLSQIVESAVRNIVGNRPDAPIPVKDKLGIDEAIEELARFGFKVSKSSLYVLTHKKAVPFEKFGSKLIFSRHKLLEWARSRNRKVDYTLTQGAIAASARRKMSQK